MRGVSVDDFIKTLVLQLPNFIGLVAAIVVLWRNNERLLAIIERNCLQEEKEEEPQN